MTRISSRAPPASPPPCCEPSWKAALSLFIPNPGMSTHESRGNETTVAFAPEAGMCNTIIVSVFTPPPSCCVFSSFNSAALAPGGR